MASTLRVSRQIVEVLATGNGKLRVSRQAVEVLTATSVPTGQEHDVAASDALALNQAAGVVVRNLHPSATDTLTLSSTAGVVFNNLHPSLADTLALSQTAVAVVQRGSVFSASSRLWLAHAAKVVAPRSLDVQDALDTVQQQYNANTGAMLDVIVGLQDVATATLTPATSRPALDRLSFAEQVVAVVLRPDAKPAVALDTVVLVDNAWLNGTPGASSVLALGDAADATVGKVFRDAITLTDLAAVNHIGGAAVSSVLAIDHSVAFIVVRPDTRWQYTPFVGTGRRPTRHRRRPSCTARFPASGRAGLFSRLSRPRCPWRCGRRSLGTRTGCNSTASAARREAGRWWSLPTRCGRKSKPSC